MTRNGCRLRKADSQRTAWEGLAPANGLHPAEPGIPKGVGEAYIFAQCSGGNSGGHDLMIPGAILRGGTSLGSEGTQ